MESNIKIFLKYIFDFRNIPSAVLDTINMKVLSTLLAVFGGILIFKLDGTQKIWGICSLVISFIMQLYVIYINGYWKGEYRKKMGIKSNKTLKMEMELLSKKGEDTNEKRYLYEK